MGSNFCPVCGEPATKTTKTSFHMSRMVGEAKCIKKEVYIEEAEGMVCVNFPNCPPNGAGEEKDRGEIRRLGCCGRRFRERGVCGHCPFDEI